MEKLVYLLRRSAEDSGADLRATLVEKIAPALREGGASLVTVSVNDEDVTHNTVAIVKRDPPIRAFVSFWMENADDREPCEAALGSEAEELIGYLVAESRPMLHERPLGQRAPGANLVTCIHRRPEISREEFFDIWNNDHRVVAIETQSTFGYVRNVVVRKLTKGAPDCDGIVEESFPIGALTDPKVFYDASNDEELKQNLGRMIESCNRFLDLEPLESTPTSEYFLG
jgi:hypothetical protein